MGETGFCKNLRFSAVSCGNLRFSAQSATPKSLDLFLFPQSEIAATNFYDSVGSLGEELGEILDEFFWAFRASFAVQNDPPNLLPKFLPIYHSMSCHGSCD